MSVPNEPQPASPTRKNRKRKTDWTLVIGVVTMVAGVLAVVVGYQQLMAVQQSVREVESRVAELALASQFVITSPLDCGEVGFKEVVRGVTPFRDRNYYIVVTPMRDGLDWIQDGMVAVNGAAWTGLAQFGSSDADIGQKFLIRAIATTATFGSERPRKLPDDAVFTGSVSVTRTR